MLKVVVRAVGNDGTRINIHEGPLRNLIAWLDPPLADLIIVPLRWISLLRELVEFVGAGLLGCISRYWFFYKESSWIKTLLFSAVMFWFRSNFSKKWVYDNQRKLMRTIMFSTERVTANSWGSGLFILFLVFFAIIAAGYVLIEGIENRNRSRYKLLLNCSMIITAVVPLELPMELSMVVDICCFDKTSTLTSDDMMQCLDIKDPKEEDTISALYYVVPSMQTNMETMYHIRT
ncbi:hypothetical protein Tco_1523289, partial [Tanacetum coccineum]